MIIYNHGGHQIQLRIHGNKKPRIGIGHCTGVSKKVAGSFSTNGGGSVSVAVWGRGKYVCFVFGTTWRNGGAFAEVSDWTKVVG